MQEGQRETIEGMQKGKIVYGRLHSRSYRAEHLTGENKKTCGWSMINRTLVY